jgi:hypothetical protein
MFSSFVSLFLLQATLKFHLSLCCHLDVLHCSYLLLAELFLQPQSVRHREHILSQLQWNLKDVLCDLANRLYQGVLYSPNVTRCHGTGLNVILFAPLRKIRPSMRRHSQNSQLLSSIMCGCFVLNFHPNLKMN